MIKETDLTVDGLMKMLIAKAKADRKSVLKQTEAVLEFLSTLVTESIDDVPPPEEKLRPMAGGKCKSTWNIPGSVYDIVAADAHGVWLRRSDMPKSAGVVVSTYNFENGYKVTSEPKD